MNNLLAANEDGELERKQKISICVVCTNNINTSIEAHHLLKYKFNFTGKMVIK